MTLEEFNNELANNNYVVVKFGATWCGPCKVLEETLSEIEPQHTNIKFIHIDVEESPELTAEYRIRNVPVMLFIRNGEVVNKLVGAVGASLINDNISQLGS